MSFLGLSSRSQCRRVAGVLGCFGLLAPSLTQTANAQVATSGAIISEFRFRGPNGSADEYVELYNTQSAPLDISGWSIRTNTANGLQTATVPANTQIPSLGHFLFTGSAYSLGVYGQSDAPLGDDALDDSGVALFNAAGAIQDAVGFATSDGSLREGNGLPSAPVVGIQHAFVRDFNASQPKNSADSSSDFVLVATDAAGNGAPPMAGTSGDLTAQLGAPSPQGLRSPVYVNNQVGTLLLDTNASQSSPPNRVRTGTGDSGTLLIRRQIVNQSGRTLTRVRFGVTRITSLGSAVLVSNQADIRLRSSSDETVSLSDGTSVPVSGTRLEADASGAAAGPSQAMGGGLGSSTSFTAVLSSPLPDGESRNYAFLLDIVRAGNFSVIFNIEALPGQAPPPTYGVDLMVGAGAALTGENELYPDPQTQSLDTTSNTPAIFRLVIQNTGNARDNFRISGRGDTPGWKVRYFDKPTGGAEVSSAIKSNSYILNIAGDARRELRIEVTPDGSVAQNAVKDVPVSIRSERDSLLNDQITARARQTGVPPVATVTRGVDASIRLASAEQYNGIGVLSPAAPSAAQTQNALASSISAAVYNWRIQNTGNTSDSFKLTIPDPAATTGWTVRLFDALDGGTEITADARTGNYSTALLAPGAFIEVRLEVQPETGTMNTLAVNLTAASVGDTQKTDVCAANTSIDAAAASLVVTSTTGLRAAAGGIDTPLHKVSFIFTAQRNGAPLANAQLALSFENNVGHNYGTDAVPDIRRPAKIYDANDTANPWKETLNVMTDNQGQVPVTVLSSDVISQPRLIARWENAGQTFTIGGVKLDFAAAISKRGTVDPVTGDYPGWQNDDTGWTCDYGALQKVGDTTQVKLFMKFRDAAGNLQPVVGHQISISMGQLNTLDGLPVFDGDEQAAYVTFLNGSTERTQITAATDLNGIATVTLKAKAGFESVRAMAFTGTDVSQWMK